MRINPSQLRAFHQKTEANFIRNQVARLYKAFPSQTADLERQQINLDGFVVNQQRRAGNYQVVNEQDFELYLDCAIVLGTNFDVSPLNKWMTDILIDQSLSGTDKMSRIHDRLLFRSGWE